MTSKFDYQIKAFEKLSQLRCGALFMSIGTGKTKTMMDIITYHHEKIDCIIWIAPASLHNDVGYTEELEKWNIKNITLKKFTIESISQSDEKYISLINIAKNNRVFCVIDESLTIKNLLSKRTKRLLLQGHLFSFRFILNGTPATKSLIDLYPQINFLSHKILAMTERQFANNFLNYYKTEGFRPYARWSKPCNEQALIEIIRPYIFDQELDIEPKKEILIYNLNLSDEENFLYREFKEKELKEENYDFLCLAQKFQNFYTFSKSKLLELEKIIEKSKKIIIFVKFVNELKKLKEIYPNAFMYSGIHKDNLKDFKLSDSKIILMTYGTGSLGLNLQFCNEIVFFTPSFDYKHKIQGEGRIYRMGQEENVKIHEFYLNTGLDELIKSSLNKKEKLLKNLENHIQNGGIL